MTIDEILRAVHRQGELSVYRANKQVFPHVRKRQDAMTISKAKAELNKINWAAEVRCHCEGCRGATK